MKNYLIVFISSGIGGSMRYAVQMVMNLKSTGSFPIVTFMINIIGCFCIGIVYSLSEKATWLTPEWRLALATGFCGGFTTFSAFALENVTLLRTGNYTASALYIFLSIILGIATTFAGIFILKTS